MTTQIGDHGLFCLDDDDYAAYALAMQCNALATEAALDVSAEAITAAISRPYFNTTNTTSVVVDDSAGGGSIGPLGIVGEVMRPNAGPTPFTQSSGITIPFVPSDPTTFLPRGIYLVGASVSWTLAAATANSLRQLLVYGVRQINGTVSSQANFTNLFRNQDYQGDGGNNGALMIGGLLDARAGDVATMETMFTHTNVAGDLTIPVGGWKLWATYLGSGLSI